MKDTRIRLFDVQRFSWKDGPGIRTVVFFKGCGMRCFWCHNPESQSRDREILFFEEKCVGCGRCAAACAHACHRLDSSRGHSFNREECTVCGGCVDLCPSGSLRIAGEDRDVDDVVSEISEDTEFYASSGGGVTLSGGEPLLQAEGCLDLLRECRRMRIPTAVDTAGHVPWSSLEAAIPLTDVFLFDIKTADEARHEAACGVSNRLILDNLKKLSAARARIVLRVPIVPRFNDRDGDMLEIGDAIGGLSGIERIELIPCHGLGRVKYPALGRTCSPDYLCDVTAEDVDRLETVLRKNLHMDDQRP